MLFLYDWMNESVKKTSFPISTASLWILHVKFLSFTLTHCFATGKKTRAIHNEAIPDDSNTLSTGIELFLVVNKNVVACYLTKFRVSRNE